MRATLNEGLPVNEQLSLNDMLLKAAALASEKVPDVSSSASLDQTEQTERLQQNGIWSLGRVGYPAHPLSPSFVEI